MQSLPFLRNSHTHFYLLDSTLALALDRLLKFLIVHP